MLVRRAVLVLIVLGTLYDSPRLVAQTGATLSHLLTAVVPAHLAVGFNEVTARPDHPPLIHSATNIATLKQVATGAARLEVVRDEEEELASGPRGPGAIGGGSHSPRVVRYTIVTP